MISTARPVRALSAELGITGRSNRSDARPEHTERAKRIRASRRRRSLARRAAR